MLTCCAKPGTRAQRPWSEIWGCLQPTGDGDGHPLCRPWALGVWQRVPFPGTAWEWMLSQSIIGAGATQGTAAKSRSGWGWW